MSKVSLDNDKAERNRKASYAWKWRNIDAVRAQQKKYKAEKRATNRLEENKKRRGYLASSPRVKVRSLLNLAKKRAENSGMLFDITVDQLELPETCPLLGVKINYAAEGRGGSPNSPSIDRIDNSLGYISGNVWVVSWKANRIKSNATIDELYLIYKNLKAKLA